MPCSEDPSPGQAPSLIAIEACLALGRLDGALSMCPPSVLRVLAIQTLRDVLMTALACEGHAFTEQRFHAWFAGLATLSDEAQQARRPPRVICEAILTELAHSSWQPLAELAPRFLAALFAPSDYLGNDHAAHTAHSDSCAVIAAARDLVGHIAPSPDPLSGLADLHRELSQSLLFAPPERVPETITISGTRLTLERAPLPSPRWALEMVWGENWRSAGLMTQALPFPGLIRLDAARAFAASDPFEADETQTILSTSLRDVAQQLLKRIAQASAIVGLIDDLQPGKRKSSRAPALLELLRGFGPMRSSQIETLLGATRLGVRAMLSALSDIGVLDRAVIGGVTLFSANFLSRPAPIGAEDPASDFAFSARALEEYEASMADIDAILVRRGIGLHEF